MLRPVSYSYNLGSTGAPVRGYRNMAILKKMGIRVRGDTANIKMFEIYFINIFI